MKKNLQKNKKFVVIGHTADIGIKVWGKSFGQLLKNAACGMYKIICEKNNIKPILKKRICIKKISKNDKESLLVNFLNELLYKTAIEKVVFNNFKIKIYSYSKNLCTIEVFCFGEKYSFEKHGRFLELKAATYHNLKIYKKNNSFYTQIFFDV
jgi:SHS2 domain-containing protein